MAPTCNNTHRYHKTRRARWAGLLRDDWLGHWPEGDPVEWVMAQEHEVIRDRPSARTIHFQTPQGPCYAKLVRAGKDQFKAHKRWLNSLKWRFGVSPTLRTLRVVRAMERAGLKAPPTIYAGRTRVSGKPQELLINEAVQGQTFYDIIHATKAREKRRELFTMVGKRIAELHQARVVHGDLLPKNVLVTADHQDLIYLDNDRTRQFPVPLPESVRVRNLALMMYRLRPWFRWRDLHLLIDSYLDGMGTTGKARRRVKLAVLRRIGPRLNLLFFHTPNGPDVHHARL